VIIMSVSGREYHISTVERAIAILEELANSQGASLLELTERLDAPKGSLFRHLKVLERHGLVRQAADSKRFSLGSRLIYLGHAAREDLGLHEVAAPYMTAVRDRFNETVHLGVLSDSEVVHVAVLESTQPLKMATAVGARTGAHVSALGKAILAFSAAEEVERVIAERGLPRSTSHTIVGRKQFLAELAGIHRRGYSLDDEESSLGLRCVGAPIRDARGTAISALSVSSPTERLTLDAAHEVAAVLVGVANEVSAHFGWNASD
jgi:DNA-binding IclR family transcriptional regulator